MITLGNRFFPLRTAICFFIEGWIIFLSILASYFLVTQKSYIAPREMLDTAVKGIIVAVICQSSMYLQDM
jgi:O-antigen ligase